MRRIVAFFFIPYALSFLQKQVSRELQIFLYLKSFILKLIDVIQDISEEWIMKATLSNSQPLLLHLYP
jgi:bisphosphoglycerate-dependent phosphoglycerate mutase